MVDRDWHDGYEEQGEELIDWYNSLQSGVNIIQEYCITNTSNNSGIENISCDIISKYNE